ncbi:hypothetical protein NPIL_651421 [Nephila pilipes]|uniref:Uncharacterized protein n=1 Tax=Nephila pilipes TaxID=299642 RepID=A0A8X6MRZ1_NEPPI|nr:hypothetical protein NPIL_651421 [Nephila pilipes]
MKCPKCKRSLPPSSEPHAPTAKNPFKTQKRLNFHLVSVHSYGTTDREGAPHPIRAVTRQPTITDFISVGSPEILEICETAPPPRLLPSLWLLFHPLRPPSRCLNTLRPSGSGLICPSFSRDLPSRIRICHLPSSGGDLSDPAGGIPQIPSAPGATGPVPTFLTKFQRDWSDRVKGIGSAKELDEAYSQFIHAMGGKPSRRRSRSRNPIPKNKNSGRHQPGLPNYHLARQIPPNAVEDHFKQVFSEKPHDPSFKFLTYDDHVACHLVTDHMSPEEIWDKLRSLKNSAPGPDGIFYSNFKSLGPGAHGLTAFFNKVLDLSSVPSSWK